MAKVTTYDSGATKAVTTDSSNSQTEVAILNGCFSSLTLEVALLKLAQLDLGPIRYKLVFDADTSPWTLERVNVAEKQYRAYLTLALMFPERSLVPSKEIDAFWHQHILDTEKYAQDCELIFGHFLHHFPYFGIRGKKDAASLEESFRETKALFIEHFGIDITQSVDCRQGTCGTSCGKSCSDIDSINHIQATIRPSLNYDGTQAIVSATGQVMAVH